MYCPNGVRLALKAWLGSFAYKLNKNKSNNKEIKLHVMISEH